MKRKQSRKHSMASGWKWVSAGVILPVLRLYWYSGHSLASYRTGRCFSKSPLFIIDSWSNQDSFIYAAMVFQICRRDKDLYFVL